MSESENVSLTQWMPIETAPKGHRHRFIGLGWNKRLKKWSAGETYWEHGMERWIYNGWNSDVEPPEYWMPMPEPRKASA